MSYIKKITTITAVLIMLASSLSATGAGVQVGGNPGIFINEDSVKLEKFSGILTGSMRLSRIPLAFGFGFEAGSYFSEFAYGFRGFADYYAIDLQLYNTWNLISGFGAQASIITSDFSNWTFTAGPRFFIGVNRLFYDNYIEVFAQQSIVPEYIRPLKSAEDIKAAFLLNLPLEAGIRMHF
jgi:hypothetical protein